MANSGPERIVLPDASILLDYMLARLSGLISGLVVYSENMEKNINLTKGLVFSQEVQALVAEKSGLPREDAYEMVRIIAQECWESGEDFHEALSKNPEVMQNITPEELRECFNPERRIEYVDYIFDQVFRK